jgi:hypothetical protein
VLLKPSSRLQINSQCHITAVIENLKSCLTDDVQATPKAFSLFESRYFSTLSNDDVVSAWEALDASFGNLVDKTAAKCEYLGFRGMLTGCYKNKDFKSVAKLTILRHKQQYRNVSNLVETGLCISVSSVPCERVFSIQNHIKIKARASLSTERLSMLIKLSLGPDVANFDYASATVHWKREKRRCLARLYDLFRPRVLEAKIMMKRVMMIYE